MALGATTYTATTWTAGDLVTETKLDNMTANDQAYDSHAANGYLSNNDLGFWCKDLGGTNRELAVVDSGDIAKIGTSAVDCGFRTRIKARAYNSANQTVNASTESTMSLDAESWDLGSDFNTTTDTFTAPIDGYYAYVAQCTTRGSTTDADTRYIVRVKVGGATIGVAHGHSSKSDFLSITASGTLSLSASDTVTVTFENTNAGSNVDIQGDSAGSFFNIYLTSIN